MLSTLGAAIKARLESLALFKVVEKSITKRALQSPPAAVFYLASDDMSVDKPSATRSLTWQILVLVSGLDSDKGQDTAYGCLDAIRTAFTGWLVVSGGGCLPTSVPQIRFEAFEDTLLIYSVRVTMQIIPAIIDK